MRTYSRLFVPAPLVTLLLTAAGCCSSQPDRHPVQVSLGNFSEKPAIEVHIVALNPQEAKYLSDYSMTRYWSKGDRERENLNKYVMHFYPDSSPSQSFSPAAVPQDWDRYWHDWEQNHATLLFVLARLPGSETASVFEDKLGSLDARRQVVPLDRCRWEKSQQPIEFELTAAKIKLKTPFKEEQP